MPSEKVDAIFDDAFFQRLQRLRAIARRTVGGRSAGRHHSTQLGDGLEFADHRPYAAGDDVRFIDWPYYARMEKLLLRLFHLHRESQVAILLDVSASMAPGGDLTPFHAALRATAALAYVAMTGLDQVTIHPFAGELLPPHRTARNSEQILPVLEYLADLAASGVTHLARCTESFTRRQNRPAGVFLISDLLDCSQQLDAALAILRRRPADLAVLHVFSQAQASPTDTGPLLLRDAETHQPMSVDVTDELLAAYRHRWKVLQAGCESICAARGVPYVAAAAEQPFDRLVLITMQNSRVLATR